MMENIIKMTDGKGNSLFPIPALSKRIIVDATNGTEYGDGSDDYPVISIEKALILAQSSGAADVYVILRNGTYNVSSQITIDAEGKKINIIATENAEINWMKRYPCILENGLYKAECTTKPNTIYANGKRIYTASSTRPTMFTSSGVSRISSVQAETVDGISYIGLKMSDADITALTTNDRYKYMWFTIFKWWTSQKLRVSIDTTNKLALLRVIDNGNGDTPVPEAACQIIAENIPVPLEMFSSATTLNEGTYYYDGSYIYYKPKTGETLEYVEIPMQGCVMDIVSDAAFYGVKFRGAGYDFMANGYACKDTQGAYSIDGAIKVHGSASFIGCEFTDIEQTCIEYMNGSHNSSVNHCYFHNIGCASIKIGETDKKATNLPHHIEMRNSLVAYCGELLQQSCGIVMSLANDCHIEHNEVMLVPYTGITAGHVWTSVDSDPATNFKKCSISYNKVHHYSADYINDLGGIYNLGDTDGMEIIGNEIHHCTNGYGIYLDNGSAHIKVRDNKVWGTSKACLINRWCQYDTITNNIFCNSRNKPIDNQPTSDNRYVGIVVENNVLYSPTGTILDKLDGFAVNKNLWYGNSGLEAAITSIGSNNVYGSPNYKDSANGDFESTDDTNLKTIGFAGIKSVCGNLKSALADYESACKIYEQSHTGLIG